ncbi:MAG: hypothetical protein ACQETL_14740 [Bacteroidota bacterium]
MKAESIKLGLIERLMKEHSISTLQRMNQLITQAEMEASAKESLEDIKSGEVLTLDDFKNENQKWIKKNHIK